MSRLLVLLTVLLLTLGLALLEGCDSKTARLSSLGPEDISTLSVAFSPEELQILTTLSPLGPLPDSPTNRVADHPEAVDLGKVLFFESRWSRNREVSCATCHDPQHSFSDPQPRSVGLSRTKRNAPALWNLAWNRWYFWDGRADSLWSQSLKPLEHEDEMGSTRVRIARFVATDPELSGLYQKVFSGLPSMNWDELPRDACPKPSAIDHPHHLAWHSLPEADKMVVNQIFANIGKAIEAYERTLVIRKTPFDRFVAGLLTRNKEEVASLSPKAQRGLKIFAGKGQCTLCHHGPNFTDREFHNIGLDEGSGEAADLGRFAGIDEVKVDPFNGLGPYSDNRSEPSNRSLRYVARKPANLGEFKTPSLRNVARTPPYMHDGRFSTLGDVLQYYSELDQEAALGHREEALTPLHLSPEELADLEAFLESLSGDPENPEMMTPPKRSPLPRTQAWKLSLAEFGEVDFQIKEGAEVFAEFQASAPVAWDCHTHTDDNTIRIINSGHNDRGVLTLRAPADGVFCFLFSNTGPTLDSIEVSVTLRGDFTRILEWKHQRPSFK